MIARVLVFVAGSLAACGAAFAIASGCQNAPAPARTDAALTAIAVPGATPSDLRFSSALGGVLVPGGASGKVYLVDDRTFAVSVVGNFSSPKSVDEVGGQLLVADALSLEVLVASPSDGHVLARAALHAPPALVRSIVLSDEVWVTEPSVHRIEVFRFDATAPPTLTLRATIDTSAESLVADGTRARAYTNAGAGVVASLDAFVHTTVESWPSGCAGTRAGSSGLALDEARGILFVACDDGSVALIDVGNHGAPLATFADDAGVSALGYSALLGHLYVALAQGGVDITELASEGGIDPIDRRPSSASAACLTADYVGNVFMCDQAGGSVVVVPDLHAGIDY
jgi:hypothetical protein